MDEAHTISTWGMSFRSSMLKMGQIRQELLPGVPTLALTASATPKVGSVRVSHRLILPVLVVA